MSIESSAAVFRTYTKRFILGLALSLLVVPVHQMQADEPNHANYEAAQKYSSTYLRQFSYTTSVRPRWIGKSNRFWYSYRTSTGTQYWLVDAKAKTKTSLFDRDKLAALLSIEVKKPLDAANLSLSGLTFTESETAIKFVAERIAFEYDLTKESMT